MSEYEIRIISLKWVRLLYMRTLIFIIKLHIIKSNTVAYKVREPRKLGSQDI